MTTRIKVIIVVLLVLGLIKIVSLIKKGALELKYALTWLLLSIGLALIVLVPGLLTGIIFLIIIIFGLTMSISRNSDRVRQLAQSMALQDYENRNK